MARETGPRAPLALEFHPLTPDRWADLEALFGPRGAYGGCWCMYWRIPRKQWEAQRGDGNREAWQAIVASGAEPGLLAYADGRPVGWCAVAPRAEYPGLERSRKLRPLDSTPVWSVTCFYVARGYRRRGVTVGLLQAAAAYVRGRGGQVVEGYALQPTGNYPDAYAYMGLAGAFVQAGFTEVARVGKATLIMRCYL